MIGFFRKIRKKMADDNKPLKYFRYAIGEILLVVIGILIAVQVNNWNEGRKANKQEITILQNIKEDINLDTLDLGFNLSYHRKFFKAEQDLLDILMSKNEGETFQNTTIKYDDALGALLWTALHESTFINLQNNEIGIIENNVLRKEIARFYDFYHQAIKMMSNDLGTFNLYEKKLPYFKKYFRLKDSSTKLLDIQGQQDYFEHNLSKREIYLWDLNGAKNDDEFKFTLNEILFLRKALVDFHATILEEITILTQSIDKEIQALNGQKE